MQIESPRKHCAKLKILIACLLLSACKNDDGLDCSLVDCIIDQQFTIEFIDNQGNNLIENEAYNLNQIIVTTNGREPYVDQSNYENYLVFYYTGKLGEQVYEIQLNSFETDTLVLNLSKKELQYECCGPYFDVDEATYNVKLMELTNLDLASDKIIVVK